MINFEIGNTVIVKKKGYNFYIPKLPKMGETGKVVEVDKHEYVPRIKVEFEDGMKFWYFMNQVEDVVWNLQEQIERWD